jgi:hypothetical protein
MTRSFDLVVIEAGKAGESILRHLIISLRIMRFFIVDLDNIIFISYHFK